jgi:hypothetical protein
MIGITVHEAPHNTPSAHRAKSFIQNKLQHIDYETLRHGIEEHGNAARPKWTYNHDGLMMTIFPLPLSPEKVGTNKNGVIGMRMAPPVWTGMDRRTRRGLIDKAKRYGYLGAPFIVAINATKFGFEFDDFINALFGDIVVSFPASGEFDDSQIRLNRKANGVWISKKGPRYTRLSGVLAFMNLYHTNISSAKVLFFKNPWAEFPAPSVMNSFDTVVLETGGLNTIKGKTLGEILELPSGWPLD